MTADAMRSRARSRGFREAVMEAKRSLAPTSTRQPDGADEDVDGARPAMERRRSSRGGAVMMADRQE
nr:hypothetical protein CFP56_09188 [Quercus suber]